MERARISQILILLRRSNLGWMPGVLLRTLPVLEEEAGGGGGRRAPLFAYNDVNVFAMDPESKVGREGGGLTQKLTPCLVSELVIKEYVNV